MGKTSLTLAAPLVLACCASAQAQDYSWGLRGSSSSDATSSDRSLADARPSAPLAPSGPATTTPDPGASTATQIFAPSIVNAILFDDNLYATKTNKRSDFAYVVRPELGFSRTDTNYGIQANVYAEHRKYFKTSGEDRTDAGASLGGTIQLTQDSQLQLRGSYARGHEDRGSGESVLIRTDRPTPFNQFDGGVALNNRFGKLWTSVGLAGLFVKYEDAKIGGTKYDQGYRDGRILVANGRVGYVVAPRTSVFVEVAANRREFKIKEFNSEGYRLVGGLLFEPGPGARMKGEVWAGLMQQDFKHFQLKDDTSYTYGGSLSFLVTNDLTLGVEGRREAKESGLDGGTSVISSYAAGRLDYRLAPNLYIGGGLTYLNDMFKGTSRRDHYWGPFASLKYHVNKNISLGLDYKRLQFHTNDAFSEEFTRNVAMASATARF